MSKIRALDWWKPALCGVSMLLLAAAPLYADTYIFRAPEETVVRITSEPCETRPAWIKMFKGSMHWHGKDYALCWLGVGRLVLIFDEAGDLSVLPFDSFRKEESI